MITHKQQRPAFYLLFLAFTCGINVPLQAMEQNNNQPADDWVREYSEKIISDKENDGYDEKDYAWVKEYLEKIIGYTLQKNTQKKGGKIRGKAKVIKFDLKRTTRPGDDHYRWCRIAKCALKSECNKDEKNSILLFSQGSAETQDAIVKKFNEERIGYANTLDYTKTLLDFLHDNARHNFQIADTRCHFLLAKKGKNSLLRAIHYSLKIEKKAVFDAILPTETPRKRNSTECSLSPLIRRIVDKLHSDKCNGVRVYVPNIYKKVVNDMENLLGFKKEKRPALEDHTIFSFHEIRIKERPTT